MNHVSGSRERVEFVRTGPRCPVKRGNPPGKQEKTTRAVLEQAGLLSSGWAAIPLAIRLSLPIGESDRQASKAALQSVHTMAFMCCAGASRPAT